jgi:uracil-DNA glycosylase family 4
VEEFDWDTSKLSNKPIPIPRMVGINETYQRIQEMTWEERTQVMLNKTHDFCINCTMCPLGRDKCTEHDTVFDPHVFSTMNPSKWMVVGQNPGYNECLIHQPFVGDAGKAFDNAISRHGVNRKKFYISNILKCHTLKNEKPTFEHVSRCEAILRLEISILQPIFVVTLGQVAFEIMCPNLVYGDSLGKLQKSERFGVKVFPIYHPSPRNLSDADRKKKFLKHIGILCKTVIAWEMGHA